MKVTRFIPYSFIYIYASLLWTLLLFTFFRVLLFVMHIDLLMDVENLGPTLARSMAMGLRFDISISCYVLLVPLLLSIVAHFVGAGRLRNVLLRVGHIWIIVLFIVVLCLVVVDIPFFNQFYLRLNSMALTWLKSSPQVVCGMILGESSYWKYIALAVVVAIIHALVQRAMYRKFILARRNSYGSLSSVPIILVTMLLLVFGVRGGVSGRPLRSNFAYFSTNTFINQMSLNPVFMLAYSATDDRVQQHMALTESAAAMEFAREVLKRDGDFKHVETASCPRGTKPTNVVVIMLESIANLYLNQTPTLTPFLVELRDRSLYFKNMYSAGVHTHDAIHATMFSYPGFMHLHTMEMNGVPRLGSMIDEFHKHGYKSMLHITHDKNFDNIYEFISNNNVKELICDMNYPKNEIKTSFGVPDHVMFDRALVEIGRNHDAGVPSLSFLLTTSNHSPYYLPENVGFKPQSSDITQQVIEYTDWSLRRFMEQASKQEWFDNTVFVIEGDHGLSTKSKYPISLTYNHIPLMIYAPGLIEPAVVDDFMLQMDILPTVCGLLGYGYTNVGFGVDALKNRRSFAYFSADWAVCAVSDRWLFVHKHDDADYLFDLVTDDGLNMIDQFPEVADSLGHYSISMTQAAYDRQCALVFGELYRGRLQPTNKTK